MFNKTCPSCGSKKLKHYSYASGGDLPPGDWEFDECERCQKKFNLKEYHEDCGYWNYGPFHNDDGSPMRR